jgi:hypothetical protein
LRARSFTQSSQAFEVAYLHAGGGLDFDANHLAQRRFAKIQLPSNL